MLSKKMSEFKIVYILPTHIDVEHECQNSARKSHYISISNTIINYNNNTDYLMFKILKKRRSTFGCNGL